MTSTWAGTHNYMILLRSAHFGSAGAYISLQKAGFWMGLRSSAMWQPCKTLQNEARYYESVTGEPQRAVCTWYDMPKMKKPLCRGFSILAERGGFEPPIGYEPIHAFQACDLNHSSISPDGFSHLCEAAYYSNYSRQYKGVPWSCSARGYATWIGCLPSRGRRVLFAIPQRLDFRWPAVVQ